ncbi:nucleotide-binding alpha-beta plait domain-containing protein [Tanacetum coccineum]
MRKKATSFLFTNYSDSWDSKALWKMFNRYGIVVDVYVAFKKTKLDSRFGFVRFINIGDLDSFENRLKGIMIGDTRSIINRAKFIKVGGKGIPVDQVPDKRHFPAPIMVALLNIYTPQASSDKVLLWNSIENLINSIDTIWIIFGDFNVVRCKEERAGMIFKACEANAFNDFLSRIARLKRSLEDWDIKTETGLINEFDIYKREKWLMDLQVFE